MELPLDEAAEYIAYAFDQEREQAAWELWLTLYPLQAMKWIKPVKFSDFRNEIFAPTYRYTEKTDEEIIQEMTAVVTAYEGR